MTKDQKSKQDKKEKELELFLKNSQKRTGKNAQPNFLFWVIIFAVGWILISTIFENSTSGNNKPFNEFIKQAKEGNVLNLTVVGDDIKIKLTNGEEFSVKKETNSTIDQILTNNQIPVSQIKGELKV
jgi:ATP-dependent Zn protease